MFKILIMGLPGSGKTTLAEKLVQYLSSNKKSVTWINADSVRSLYNDWDFSHEGRIRQARRLANLANVSDDDYTIVDFVAPLSESRNIFDADYTIWMDTKNACSYEDTNKIFTPPDMYDVRIESINYSLDELAKNIINNYINKI